MVGLSKYITRITKNWSNHEIFITKINIHVIFSSFKKKLNHEKLELYGVPCLILAPRWPPTIYDYLKAGIIRATLI